MTKEEKIIREYFEPIDDINGDKTIEVLPLSLMDMLLEYGELVKNLTIPNVSISDCSCGSDKTNESATGVKYCSNCGKDR